MNVQNMSHQIIEDILTKLGYLDLDFRSIDTISNTISYEGYLDTAYVIQIHAKSTDKLEIWDCIYDEENYVRSGIATRGGGEWLVLEG